MGDARWLQVDGFRRPNSIEMDSNQTGRREDGRSAHPAVREVPQLSKPVGSHSVEKPVPCEAFGCFHAQNLIDLMRAM